MSRAFTRVEVRIHRSGRKTIGGRIAGDGPVLLLVTTGRRTGRRRTTPLLYHREEKGDLLLVAANGGADWHPHWLHNLEASPEAQVELDDRRLHVVAAVLDAGERAAAWPLATRVFPGLSTAQQGTSRAIPLVRLHVVS
jgi:deazaflavin-dependent oxidoreductase (nitroreductase family)